MLCIPHQPCNETCPHWSKCLKELGLPKNWKPANWVEEKANVEEIALGRTHKSRDGEIVVWRIKED